MLAHKGKAALELRTSGIAGHSSRPDLGRNAIHALLPALACAVDLAETLPHGPQDARFEPPYSTVQIGTVDGGQAMNIIPDAARAQIEARAIDGVDPRAVLQPLLGMPGVDAQWLSSYPAMALDAGHPLAALLKQVTGQAPLGAVSFGTEGGLYQQAGIPAIVCGPGDIARAHKPEEYITVDELAAAQRMIESLGKAVRSGAAFPAVTPL